MTDTTKTPAQTPVYRADVIQARHQHSAATRNRRTFARRNLKHAIRTEGFISRWLEGVYNWRDAKRKRAWRKACKQRRANQRARIERDPKFAAKCAKGYRDYCRCLDGQKEARAFLEEEGRKQKEWRKNRLEFIAALKARAEA